MSQCSGHHRADHPPSAAQHIDPRCGALPMSPVNQGADPGLLCSAVATAPFIRAGTPTHQGVASTRPNKPRRGFAAGLPHLTSGHAAPLAA